MDANELAKKFGVALNQHTDTIEKDNQFQAFETLARTLSTAPKKIFDCPKCKRKFNVANPKEGKLYKCMSCDVVLAELAPETVLTVRASEVEFVLDESVPQEVQQALRDPQSIVGKFVLVCKLGEGAMGKVFKAFDVELGRYVALKFIKSEQADELRAEARTLASLEHRNIARIYEIGNNFIAMQFVQGSVVSGQWSIGDALRVMTAICEAVDYAHRHGIIHRDIKPENIMVDSEQNVFVMDFGLAERNPREGEIAGTPGYLAPEIAEGKGATRQSDIYSLGALFYSLLTGIRPISISPDETLTSVLEKCKGGIPPLPQNFPAEISAIIRKATETVPDNRYDSSAGMGADIRSFGAGEPVRAFSNSLTYRASKFMKKRKIAIAVISISLIAVLVAGIASIVNLGEKQRAEEVASKAAEELRRERDYNVKALRDEAKIVLKKIMDARRMEGPDPVSTAYSTLKELLEAKYRDVQTKAPDLAEPDFIMGRIQRAVINVPDAMKYQKKALARDPNFAPALYEYAVLLSVEFDRILSFEKDAASRRLAKSGKLGASATEEEVMKSSETLRRLEKEIVSTLARLESATGTSELLSPAFSEAAKGISLAYRGQKEEAKAALEAALKKDDGLEEVYEALAHVDSRYDLSIRWYNTGLKKIPSYYPFYIKIGECVINFTIVAYCSGTNPLELVEPSTKVLSKAINNFPKVMALFLTRGKLHKYHGIVLQNFGKDPDPQYQLAYSDFTKAIELGNGETEARLERAHTTSLRADHMKERGIDPSPQFDAAETDCLDILKTDANDVDAIEHVASIAISRGIFLMYSGKDPTAAFAKAEEHFAKGLAISPENSSLWNGRGIARFNTALYLDSTGKESLSKMKDAESDLGNCLKISKLTPENWKVRAQIRKNIAEGIIHKGGDPSEYFKLAEEDFTEALRLGPEIPEIWNRRAAMLTTKGLWEMNRRGDCVPIFLQSINDFDTAIGLTKTDAESYMGRGDAFGNIANEKLRNEQDPTPEWSAAESDYSYAVKLNPAYFIGWMRRGTIRGVRAVYVLRKGGDCQMDYDSAMKDFEEAIRRAPGFHETYSRRAYVHREFGRHLKDTARFEDAERDYLIAAKLNPSHSPTFVEMGILYVYMGNLIAERGANSEAIEFFRKAIKSYETALAINNGEPVQKSIDELKRKIAALGDTRDY